MLALGLILTLSSCSGSQVLKSFLGGGPSVAANVQAGKTNTQTVGTNVIHENKIVRPQARKIIQDSGSTKVKAEDVQTVVVNEVPVWAVLLIVLGWLLPSPSEMGRKLANLVRRKS